MKNYGNFIKEMLFNKITTNYKTFQTESEIANFSDYRFDFYTNKLNSYSIYILMTKEKNNTILDDGTILPNVVIPTILFSETKHGFNPEFFNKLTNKNEFSEVMGKIIHIILEFINKNTYNIYSIGDIDNKKLNFYEYYKYHFNMFDIKIGNSINYKNKAHYLIK